MPRRSKDVLEMKRKGRTEHDELTHIKGRTWTIESPARVGLYQLDDTRVVLIDAGSDKEAGRKIRRAGGL